MKIVRLQVRNFLGLREVDVKTGDTNIIRGKNRQGKTSLIRAIEAAFQSGDQSAKIRQGEDTAEILVELDDLYVQRSIRSDGKTKLMVADKQGEQVPRPQEFLDGLIGGFSFNPAEFFLLDKKKQIAYLLESFSVKVTKDEVLGWIGTEEWPEDVSEEFLKAHALVLVERLRKYYYEQRTVINRKCDELLSAGKQQAAMVSPGFDLGTYDEDGLKKLYAQVRACEQDNARISSLNADVQRIGNEILELERKVKLKKQELAAKDNEHKTLKFRDVSGFEKQITEFEGTKKQADAATKLIDLRSSYSRAFTESKDLDRIVNTLTNEVPRSLMERIQLPVKGMEITEDEVLFDGKSFDMLSGAEQVEVSLAIARALCGKFRVLCVDGVEKLDDEVYAEFVKQMEADRGFQFFITKVGKAEKGVGIEIEDGKVKSANGRATKAAA